MSRARASSHKDVDVTALRREVVPRRGSTPGGQGHETASAAQQTGRAVARPTHQPIRERVPCHARTRPHGGRRAMISSPTPFELAQSSKMPRTAVDDERQTVCRTVTGICSCPWRTSTTTTIDRQQRRGRRTPARATVRDRARQRRGRDHRVPTPEHMSDSEPGRASPTPVTPTPIWPGVCAPRAGLHQAEHQRARRTSPETRGGCPDHRNRAEEDDGRRRSPPRPDPGAPHERPRRSAAAGQDATRSTPAWYGQVRVRCRRC